MSASCLSKQGCLIDREHNHTPYYGMYHIIMFNKEAIFKSNL